jgi:hypothetical protein
MVSNKVTATVSTRGRFNTTFPLMLTSIINQTVKPCRLIIYDDNDTLEDLRNNEVYLNLFMLMDKVGIKWEVSVGERRGQIHNHQRALKDVETEWIWRLDDDNIMESNVLQEMLEWGEKNPKVAGVGPLILDPKPTFKHVLASNKIEDIFLGLNIQWVDTKLQEYIDVDHLQGSTFLFRRAAAGHGYDLNLSRVGHREETIFTYEMKRAGWKLTVLTGLKTWHMRYGAGGIRSDDSKKAMFDNDEKIFAGYLKRWNITPAKYKIIPLDAGIGDHFAFRSVLPDIKKRWPSHTIAIGACYPSVFEGEEGIKLLSLDESAALTDIKEHNIYAWMDRHDWKRSLADAYKTKYTL